jgi:trehalose-6-phosphate synthase
MRHLSQEFRGKKIILGIDRLDYIKGIPQKLRAFEKLLTDHPEEKEKVVLIQVAIPTRTDVEEYKMLRKQVEGMIGMINGKHGESSSPTYREMLCLRPSLLTSRRDLHLHPNPVSLSLAEFRTTPRIVRRI